MQNQSVYEPSRSPVQHEHTRAVAKTVPSAHPVCPGLAYSLNAWHVVGPDEPAEPFIQQAVQEQYSDRLPYTPAQRP